MQTASFSTMTTATLSSINRPMHPQQQQQQRHVKQRHINPCALYINNNNRPDSSNCSMLYDDPFQEFLRSWLHQLSAALFDADADSPSERLGLAARAAELREGFFGAKRELARRDPALALSLPWLSPLSRALLWLGGWRPCAAYRVAEAWAGVSAEAMRRETRAEEAAVEREMGRAQLGLLRMVAGGGAGGEEEALVMAAMERVAVAADAVRRAAVRRAAAALAPQQVLGFLAQLIRMELGFYAMEQD